jgi:hypothetical protein
VLIRFQEVIVKNNHPLCMVDFSAAMCHECTVGPLAANLFCWESFEGIWELSFKRIEDPQRKPKKYHAPSPGKQCVQTPDRTVSTSYSSTHLSSLHLATYSWRNPSGMRTQPMSPEMVHPSPSLFMRIYWDSRESLGIPGTQVHQDSPGLPGTPY